MTGQIADVTDAIELLKNRARCRVELTTGNNYSFALCPTDDIGPDQQLARELRDDASGIVARATIFSGGLTILQYEPMTAGTCFIGAEDGRTGTRFDCFGGYELTLTEQDATSAATSASVAVGGRYDGRVDVFGDEDRAAADLVAGQEYRFTLTNSDIEGNLIAKLALLNVAGGDVLLLAMRQPSATSFTSTLPIPRTPWANARATTRCKRRLSSIARRARSCGRWSMAKARARSTSGSGVCV